MADDRSLGEVGRDLARLTMDITALRVQLSQDFVLAKVHDAVVGALTERVRRLEEDQLAARRREKEEHGANRRTRYGSLVGGAVSILVAVATVIVSELLRS